MTGSDYIEFEKAMFVANRLIKSKSQSKRVKGLYIIFQINLGLRIGDILSLKWSDIMNDRLNLKEQKTGKKVDRKINKYIKEAIELYGVGEANEYIFISQKGGVYSRQAINRFLQDQWSISSHGLRKSFGRYVYDANGKNEDVLIKLSEIFNHSNIKVTKRYLGIRQTEIDNIFDAM